MNFDIPKLLVESSFCMMVFYTFYYFFLKKETFFQVNRFYLMITPFLALVIPQLNINLANVQSEQTVEMVYPALMASEELERFFWEEPMVPRHDSALSLGEFAFYLYVFGVSIMSIHLLLNLWRLTYLIMKSKKRQLKQAILVEVKSGMPIASFFNYIFWKTSDKQEDDQLIWEHEKVHIRQWHSLDLLFMEIMVIINWFNPLIYLFKKSLRLTHEYIADQAVVQYSNARLAYATLLARQSLKNKNSRLLNTFYSLTKMRLIMLGRNNSKPWRGVKYFLSLPLLMGLGLLFSFDLASSLPAPVAGPLNEAEQYLEKLGEKTLNLQLDKATYQIQWGEYNCDCYNDQFPNFYECTPSTIPLKKFKKLAKKTNGFRLLQNGQPLTFNELQVMSKRMLPLDGYEGQFDEQGTFDNNSLFWDEIEKGDVLKFTFKADQKKVFTFDVTINNNKNKLDYAYYFSFEDEDLPVDMTSNISVRTVDMVEFSKLINQPLSLKKNDGTPLRITSFQLTNQKAMRNHQIDTPDASIILSQYEAVKEAEPGDRVFLTIETSDNQKLKLSLDIRKNAAWNKERRKLDFVWGNKTIPANSQPIFLEPETIKSLADQPMSFLLNGKELKIKQIASANLSFPEKKRNENQVRCNIEDYQASSECIPQLFKQVEKGDMYTFLDIRTHTGHTLYLMIKAGKQTKPKFIRIPNDTIPEKEKLKKGSDELFGTKKVLQKKETKEEKVKQKTKEHKEEKVKIKETDNIIQDIEKNFQEDSKKTTSSSKVEPLYILDGKEIDSKAVKEIIPDHIEKIDVLKGESANAVYGEKGQNGVVVITTKKKKPEKIGKVEKEKKKEKNNKEKKVEKVQKVEKKRKDNIIQEIEKDLEKDGKNTISLSEIEPLIILDGKEVDKKTSNELIPERIEKVEVLKGESAIEKYGEKGVNGVIIITTKEE